jgi:putative glycosyltransferase (TIGR04348 family)
LNVLIIGPALAHEGRGNRVTAARWGRILSGLGHEVRFQTEYDGGHCDLLVALHAIRSAPSIERFRDVHPGLPLVVALTGTDIYGAGSMFDEGGQAAARRSMACATALVAFNSLAAEEVPAELRSKVRVISQSVVPPENPSPSRADRFEVCVVGELREVKDPFRAARAARLLPTASTVHVLHAGAAGSAETADRAAAEERENDRYRWLGELSHAASLDLIARSRLLVVSSRHEGGPNVITEALGVGTPVLASRIPGTVGILGHGYDGYFDVGDTAALAMLLRRAETEDAFLASLQARCRERSELASPAAEVDAWRDLLSGL